MDHLAFNTLHNSHTRQNHFSNEKKKVYNNCFSSEILFKKIKHKLRKNNLHLPSKLKQIRKYVYWDIHCGNAVPHKCQKLKAVVPKRCDVSHGCSRRG